LLGKRICEERLSYVSRGGRDQSGATRA
jgi:hypothetical protein